ncbi:MAG: hypothetical protein Kow00114_27090 [Kiloniellaceae bacterium]
MSPHLLGPSLMARIFDRPLAIHPDKARAILVALLPKLGAPALIWNHGAGGIFRVGENAAASGTAQAGNPHDSRLQRHRNGDRCFAFDQTTGIAHIEAMGTLVHKLGSLHMYSGNTGYDGLGAQLRAAAADPMVRGILWDSHTPGGEVSGCFELGAEMLRIREVKPIWSIAYDDALSAGYALAAAANVVVATRTAEVGSIGVWTMHIDWSGYLEQEGIVVTPIFAGDRKIDGWPYKPLPDDVRRRIQGRIDDYHSVFVEHVAAARGLTPKAVRDTEAECLGAPAGKELGLVDEVASFEDTYRAFAEKLNAAA